MKLEAGKTYRLRNGEIVRIEAVNEDAYQYEQAIGWLKDDVSGWALNGKYTQHSPKSKFDIIAEHTEGE